jgi:hypothetical protein
MSDEGAGKQVAPGDPPAGSAAATVRAYYDRLRAGEPLSPYFRDDPTTVKFGVGERLTGYEAVEAGLRAQTEITTDWVVESDRLVVVERDDHGWFSDDVFMAWTDTEREVRHEFDTRWSGTLVRNEGADATAETQDTPPWLFAGMHVSTSVEGR